MRKRTKLIGLVLSATLLTGTFTGFSYEEEYVPVDTQTDVFASICIPCTTAGMNLSSGEVVESGKWGCVEMGVLGVLLALSTIFIWGRLVNIDYDLKDISEERKKMKERRNDVK